MRVDTLLPAILGRLVMIGVDASLRAAAAALSYPRIGLLVACDGRGTVAGVVSKSDLVRHLATVGAADATVATVMTRSVVSCGPGDDLLATWQRMAAQSLQNMPVLGADSKPIGVLDVRDALEALFEQEEDEERLLVNYIAGVGYR